MSDFDDLMLNVYRHDPLIQKLEQVYTKFKNNRQGLNGQHIVKKQKQIYRLDISEKFEKDYHPFFECLLQVKFNHKDSFKLYLVILKILQRKNKNFIKCKKTFLEKISRLDRQGFIRCIKELEIKNMLLVKKEENDFIFTPVMTPLAWRLSENELERIREEVNREINRLDKKWIQEQEDQNTR